MRVRRRWRLPCPNGADLPMALAAVGVLGPSRAGKDGRATRALECLAALALDVRRPRENRLAALDALDGLPAHADPAHLGARSATIRRPNRRSGHPQTGRRGPATGRAGRRRAAARSERGRPPLVREDAERTSVSCSESSIDQIRVAGETGRRGRPGPMDGGAGPGAPGPGGAREPAGAVRLEGDVRGGRRPAAGRVPRRDRVGGRRLLPRVPGGRLDGGRARTIAGGAITSRKRFARS